MKHQRSKPAHAHATCWIGRGGNGWGRGTGRVPRHWPLACPHTTLCPYFLLTRHSTMVARLWRVSLGLAWLTLVHSKSADVPQLRASSVSAAAPRPSRSTNPTSAIDNARTAREAFESWDPVGEAIWGTLMRSDGGRGLLREADTGVRVRVRKDGAGSKDFPMAWGRASSLHVPLSGPRVAVDAPGTRCRHHHHRRACQTLEGFLNTLQQPPTPSSLRK